MIMPQQGVLHQGGDEEEAIKCNGKDAPHPAIIKMAKGFQQPLKNEGNDYNIAQYFGQLALGEM